MTTLSLLNPAHYDRLVWWQDVPLAETWVKERGVNILWWDSAVHFTTGDWLAVHTKVESLRQLGHDVKVIRQPASMLVPDKLDASFDVKWKSHLHSLDVGDELEDKVTGGDLFANPQPIYDAVAARIKAIKAEMPDVPVTYNFNGTHTRAELKDRYDKIIALGVDYISYDLYPHDTDQIGPDGAHLYPDVIAATLAPLKLFRAWYPTKPIYVYAGVSNQADNVAGADGWAPGFKFVGSRALTPKELRDINAGIKANGGNGIAYFPQSRGTMDATDPPLIPVMQEIAGTPPALPAGGVAGSSGGSDPFDGATIALKDGRTYTVSLKR